MRDDTLLPTLSPPKKKSPKVTAYLEDPWRDWQPQWQGRTAAASPHVTQERHAPTEAMTVRAGSAREETRCRQRLTDARLWDSLPPYAQDAAAEIALAFESLGRGMGFATSNWARVPGARNPGGAVNALGRLTGLYVDWTKSCHAAGVSHSMIIDILCFGITCRALDRDRRVRHGASRQNLADGLALYADLRGWRR